MFSLLVHEYGHALTAAFFGARPVITLEAFGGNAAYNASGMTDKERFFITLGGPLLESVLIALSYYLLKANIFDSYYTRYFLYVTFELNILWVALNLIPIAPLDGGHLAQYFLKKWFGDKGYFFSILLGICSAVLIAPYLFYQRYLFFGALLVILGFQNYQALQKFRVSFNISPFELYMRGLEAVKNNNFKTGQAYFKKLLSSKDTQFKHFAIEALAKLYIEQNRPKLAYKLLLSADPQHLKEGKCLLCKLAFDFNNNELIRQHSREIYEIEPTYETALLNSKAFARLNDPNLSGAWLFTATQFRSFPKETLEPLIHSPIYQSVIHQDLFKKHLEKIELN